MKKLSSILAIVLVLCSLFVLVPSAEEAYDTYTYSIDGDKLLSPDAYSAKDMNKPLTSKEMGLSVPLGRATDIVADQDGNVYIADPEHNLRRTRAQMKLLCEIEANYDEMMSFVESML